MKYELRILSGLHRGAAMPLDDEALLMGASEYADIVLVDPGIEPKHAKISRTESGWVLSAEGGDLYAPDRFDPQELVNIEPGGFARVGQIWITVAEEGEPWVSPPPDPLPPPVVDEADDEADSEMPDEETAIAEEQTAHAETDAGAEAAMLQSGNDKGSRSADAKKENDEQSDTGYAKLRRMLITPLAVIAVLSGAGAYALTATKSSSGAGQKVLEKLNIQADLKILMPDSSAPSAQAEQTDAKPDKADVSDLSDKAKVGKSGKPGKSAKAASEGGSKLTPEQLRQAFRKRLSDADLLKRFELALTDESWLMKADLDDEETARFERVLKGFMSEHKVTIPIQAKVVSTGDMLPFRIVQVISGSQASIVTEDGTRLYVGDEYRGVRVTAINGNRLAFAGKRKIEVTW